MGTGPLSAWLGHVLGVCPRRRALPSFLVPCGRAALSSLSHFPGGQRYLAGALPGLGGDNVQVLIGSQLAWLCHARPCPVEFQ